MDFYLSQIKDDRLLTAQEECLLAEAIARGDKNARNRMIQTNLRLVVKIARDYRGRGLTLEDLVGEGNLGLIRAVEDYDPKFGTRFSTYASHWINQAILHALTNTTSTIRIPAHMVGLLTKWKRMERALSKEQGQAPTDEQIASALGISDAQRSLVNHARRANQLRLESASAEDTGWSADATPDIRESLDSDIDKNDERRFILKRLDRLEDRERVIVTLRYGLEGEDPLTLKQVGSQLGVTREWVRKIEIRALEKLKEENFSNEKAKVSERSSGVKRAKRTRVAKRRSSHQSEWSDAKPVKTSNRVRRSHEVCATVGA